MFYKFLISLMLCAIISLFFISKPNGQKLLNSTVILQDVVRAFEQVRIDITGLEFGLFSDTNDNPKSVTLYRWQDSQGQWHLTDKENSIPNSNENTQANAITVTANSSISVKKTSHTETAETDNKQQQILATESLSTHPLSNAFNTLEDAKNIQTLMDNHGEQLDNVIKNIVGHHTFDKS